jgi:hypothetical protein
MKTVFRKLLWSAKDGGVDLEGKSNYVVCVDSKSKKVCVLIYGQRNAC